MGSIAFLIMFTIGGFSGLMLAIVPADFQYHDTYFVVAHFHYVMVPGAIFGAIAAVYYWMPRRIPDYALQFADFNMICSISAFVFGLSNVFFLFILLKTIFSGKKVTERKTWEGARGLEWTVPTPAPYHTFSTPP